MVAVFSVMGAAGGVCDVSGNTLAVWSRPRAAAPLLNRLHLCFALGALAAPLVVSRALDWFESVGPVAVVSGAVAACCIVAFLRSPPPRQEVVEVAAGETSALPAARRLQLAMVCVFFLCYVAVETGVASWIHTYVEEVDPGRPGTATAVNVSFWVGFVAGRLLAIALATRLGPGRILAGSTAVTLIAAGSFATFAHDGAALVAVVIVFAAGLAPEYAAMVSYAEHHLSLSGASTSAFVASSSVGALVLPWGIGQLFDRYGAGSLRPTILVATVACGGAAFAVRAAVTPDGGAARPVLLATPDR
jgi:fucose permease